MEQAINKLSEMLGVGVSEIYTVLQSMAVVDAGMEKIGYNWCIIAIVLSVIVLITGIVMCFNDNSLGVSVIVISFIVAVFFVFSAWSSLRNYKMWIDNPKAYAIEKIFKSIPHEQK